MLRAAVPKLVAWFRRTARDLPWRRARDPYAIWISEVMLQQTQVATVLPYYKRWIRRFPTVDSLAAASLDEVLKMWEGLGYYARARHLHQAAREWNQPRTAAQWRTLPGVGDYTAAAVASIAYGERVAVCDGNVRRVMARLWKLEEGAVRPGELDAAVPARAPGDFNQALMELGQRVCAPRRPKCGECPIASLCRARAAGMQEAIPCRAPAKRVPHYDIAVGVCRKGGRVLVAQRRAEGLLGGLWEFPGGKREKGETFEQALVREFREEVGIDVEVEAPLVKVAHRYSHFAVTLHVFTCRHRAGRARALENAGVRWVAIGELPTLAWPAANKRILERLAPRGR
ncbi:MAG: A/G-specific adenine glycosylase [Planctomycetes bacterium]|nr:A/G-specific adenine glycosylase [Planctomycetota bacterium]